MGIRRFCRGLTSPHASFPSKYLPGGRRSKTFTIPLTAIVKKNRYIRLVYNAGKYRRLLPANLIDCMRITKITALAALAFMVSTCSAPSPTVSYKAIPFTDKPKNVILMIGDGMGITQVSAALYSNNNRLNLERFPVVGLHKTYAADHLVTDSAAGATAFACGVKTFVNGIGVAADSTPVETILEEAEKRGLATGLIATSTIVHATPAAFIAHEFSRESYEAIAADILETEVDLLIGGGRIYFNERKNDNRDLYRELLAKGYYVTDFERHGINQIRLNPQQNAVYFTAEEQPLSVSAGRDYLGFASRLGAEFLEQRSEKGFFLMIEGSQIDWFNHWNDGPGAIMEVLDFDRAVGEVIEFANRTGNTLVVVTADHETGGLSLMPGSKMKRPRTSYTTNGHTATLVPVFAYGPSAELFAGIYENTEIQTKIRQALGFTDDDQANIQASRQE